MHPSYSIHPGVEYSARMIENLAARTGHSLAGWVEIVRAAGIEGVPAQRAWLRDQHGLGGTTTDMIASAASGTSMAWGDAAAYLAAAPAYVDALYVGNKHALRPLHDALITHVQALGEGVRICPTTTFVSIYHRHACAKLRPATRAEVELGLALREVALPPRFVGVSAHQRDDRINTRIRIGQLSQIDTELLHWLRVAFDQAA